MNCGPLSEMIRGRASGYSSLAPCKIISMSASVISLTPGCPSSRCTGCSRPGYCTGSRTSPTATSRSHRRLRKDCFHERRRGRDRKNFPVCKHNLIQAMLALNDLFYLAKPVVESLFFEDVVAWLDGNDVRYTPKVKFTGTS